MEGCDGGTCELEHTLQSLWLLLCTFLVVSMQLGFAMLEVGGVREAHRMTVLAKNVMDSVVSCLAFALATQCMNLSLVLDNGAQSFERMLSNWAFCATCATIVSGAMAERAHMLAYLVHAAVMSSLTYPPLAEAVWGTTGFFLHGQMHGRFRSGTDYHDCAGSGVVHLTGGCAAFSGCLLLGRRLMSKELQLDEEAGDSPVASEGVEAPREGNWVSDVKTDEWPRRFDDEARDKLEFQACSYLQVMGMFTLWVGWYGFNAGSALSGHPGGEKLAAIVAWNTTLAASAAGLGGCLYLYGFHLNLDVGFLCNSVLSGLVACTASCDVATPSGSVVVGLLSGLVVYPSCSCLMQWAKIDDPVDAVAVHAGSGFFGVLATAFCAPDCEQLRAVAPLYGAQAQFCSPEHTLLGQLEMQLWGAFLIISWALLISMSFFLLCALSERVRCKELVHIRETQEILSQLAGDLGEAPESLRRRLSLLASKSPLVGRLLQNGPQNLKELPELRAQLVGLAQQRVTGLERGSCLEALASRCYVPCRPLARLRLRIHPSAELSGHGALKADGGKVYEALHRAAHQIAELRAEHRSVHSPLKRNVKELSLIVKSQDILLRALARRRSPRRSSTLQSVAEEDEQKTPTKPYPAPAPAPPEASGHMHSAFPASSDEPYPIHRVRSESTISDSSLGALSAPLSANGSTPRPTIFGREIGRGDRRAPDANDVAEQLTVLLQTQQHIMSMLAAGSGQTNEPSPRPMTPQCEPPMMAQRNVLSAALEVLAARNMQGAGSMDVTPRTLDMSRGPSTRSFGSDASTATQRDR